MLRRSWAMNPAQRVGPLVRPCLAIVEAIIGLRVIFRALGSQDTGFVSLIYQITGPLVSPWRGIVADASSGGHIFDSSALIAMGVYAVAAAIVLWALRAAVMRPRW